MLLWVGAGEQPVGILPVQLVQPQRLPQLLVDWDFSGFSSAAVVAFSGLGLEEDDCPGLSWTLVAIPPFELDDGSYSLPGIAEDIKQEEIAARPKGDDHPDNLA